MSKPNTVVRFKASDPAKVGKTLTPEKEAQLKELIGDDELFNSLMAQANGAVTEAQRRTAGQVIKAEETVPNAVEATTLPTGSEDKAMEVEVEEGDDAEGEGEQSLLSAAEIDQIADAVMNRIMSKLDELNAGVAAIDTEMKARGYQRAKGDEDPLATRVKSLEGMLESLTTNQLPRSVMNILSQTRSGIELKGEEADAIMATPSSNDPLSATRGFLFNK